VQAFEVNWLRWLLVMSLSGVVAAIALFLGFYLPSQPGRPGARDEEHEAFPAGIKVANRGVPPILVLVYIGTIAFIIAYVVYVCVAHPNL
jgi:hypothetical protein